MMGLSKLNNSFFQFRIEKNCSIESLQLVETHMSNGMCLMGSGFLVHISFLLISVISAARYYNYDDCKCWPGYTPDFEKPLNKVVCIKLIRKAQDILLRIIDLPSIVECNSPAKPIRPGCKCSVGGPVSSPSGDWCAIHTAVTKAVWICENQRELDEFDKAHPSIYK